MATPLDEHRIAYEEFLDLQAKVQEAATRIEDARKQAVAYLADSLGHVEGVEQRLASGDGPEWAGADDPILALVMAAESNYYRFLGHDKPQVPLAIWHANAGWLGNDFKCPHCDEVIKQPIPSEVPSGTRPR